MNLLVRLAPRGCPHLRGLLSRPAPLDHVWRRSCFFTTERRDPTAALGHFYGESFEVPSLSQGPSPASGTLSRGGDATHQAPAVAPVTVEALVRAETDAEMTVYRIDQALGKPPLQLVLSLDTNRQRTGLAEALLRKVSHLRPQLIYSHSHPISSHPLPSSFPRTSYASWASVYSAKAWTAEKLIG